VAKEGRALCVPSADDVGKIICAGCCIRWWVHRERADMVGEVI